MPTEEILAAIAAVCAAGGNYFSAPVSDPLSERGSGAPQLTAREHEVLAAAAAAARTHGRSNKLVALQLDISVRTVETGSACAASSASTRPASCSRSR